jgi:hypothetical protein
MIEGTDPKTEDTYVLFGAHLDRWVSPAATAGDAGGQCCRWWPADLIFNGADDDGSPDGVAGYR